MVRVRVRAGESREKVERIGKTFRIAVRELAKEGRANDRVRELVAYELMVAPAAVHIVSGHHRPNKLLEVRGIGILER